MGLKRNSKGELAEVTPLRSRKGSIYIKGSNDKFKMMKIDDMGDSCTYNSMDIFMAPMSDTDRTVIDSTIDDRRTTMTEFCRPQ